eukprot:4320674-Pyramimonas_sp.AAC.1
MVFGSWGPCGSVIGGISGRLGGLLGRQEAIWCLLSASVSDSARSSIVSGASRRLLALGASLALLKA